MLLFVLLCFTIISCQSHDEVKPQGRSSSMKPLSSSDNIKSNIAQLEKMIREKPDDFMSKDMLAIQYGMLGGKDNYDKAFALYTDIYENAPAGVIKESAKKSIVDMQKNSDAYMKGSFDERGKYKG
jgi:hypothetical protein